jgi:UDP-glucose 4-epimerase
VSHTLITGGAGFIGSHLAERLIAAGDSVTVLDDLSTGSRENLTHLTRNPRFTLVKNTILNEPLVRKLTERCDRVVHLAAAVGVRYVLQHPLSSIKTNVDGTDIVLKCAAVEGRKTIVASTSEVYGKNESERLCETADSILGSSSISRWSYATAKKLDEFLALAYAETLGLPVVVTRFFNIVGPRQRARYGMVLPNFVRAALAGEPIRVFGDGQQTRNFCFVGDCIDALMGLLHSDSANGEAFNIGGPEEVSMNKLAERVKQLIGSGSPIVKIPYLEAYPEGSFEDMRRRVPCVCKIERVTGWKPRTGLDAIILETASYEERHRQAADFAPVEEPVAEG